MVALLWLSKQPFANANTKQMTDMTLATFRMEASVKAERADADAAVLAGVLSAAAQGTSSSSHHRVRWHSVLDTFHSSVLRPHSWSRSRIRLDPRPHCRGSTQNSDDCDLLNGVISVGCTALFPCKYEMKRNRLLAPVFRRYQPALDQWG